MIHARNDYNGIQPRAGGKYIPDDEPVFLIRSSDRIGSHAVNAWADLAEETGADPELVAAVRRHAEKMHVYAVEHYDGGKVPDAPPGVLA